MSVPFKLTRHDYFVDLYFISRCLEYSLLNKQIDHYTTTIIYKKIITFDTFIILVIISGSCNEKLLGNIITFVAYGTWHMRSVVAWSLSPGYQRWYNTLARHKASNPSCQVSLFVLSHLIISYQMRFSKVGKHLLNVLKSLFCFSCTNKSNLFFLEFGKI